MNSASNTIDLLDRGQISQVPVTDLWREIYKHCPEKALDLFRWAKVAGLASSLAISPVTAMSDPWLFERKRRDSVVTMSIYQEILGRFISRSEALRIARQILEQAEQEQLALAEIEAARGIQWGDQS